MLTQAVSQFLKGLKMNSYTWHITSVDVFPEFSGKQNVVATAKFCVSGTDGVNTATASGSQDLTLTDVSQFVEYANLTEAQIIDWVKTALGESGQATYTARVDAVLTQKATPTVSTLHIPLPWKLSL
jgi:hypothetical protein